MNRLRRLRVTACFSVLPVLAIGASSLGDDKAGHGQYFSSAELASGAGHPENGILLRELATDPSATTLIIRRDRIGEFEVHTAINDIFVVESGHATVIVGGLVRGNHEIRPTEWRGGEVTGGEAYELGPGDVLLIAAGLPHRVAPHPGETFIYVTIKTPTKA
jgi:mannose-6-phosphate isomerase-like protein (cupin superfamily)